MVAVERAGVLRIGARGMPSAEKALPRRMGVQRRSLQAGLCTAECNTKAAVERHIANDNIAVMVDQQKIACLHVAEALAERVHPEVIRQDWVTGVICPATPSPNPRRPKTLNVPASFALR